MRIEPVSDRATRTRVRAVSGSSVLSLLIFLAFSAAELAAQIPGNVDWPTETGGTGVAVSVDATRGLNYGAGKSLYLGTRITFGMPRAAVWFGGGMGGLAGAGDNAGGGGAGFALQLTESALTRLSLEVGIGAARESGSWLWGAPVGLTLWFIPAESPVRPFVRAHALVAGGGGYDTDFGVAGVGGVQLHLPSGVGLHVAVHGEKIGWEKAVAVGAGVSFGH